MTAMWGQLGALGAPRPGCLCYSHHGAAWPPIQCLWSEQISTKKIENVESATAAQQSNARIAKTNRRSRFGETLSTFSFEEEEEGGSALLSQLIAAELEIHEKEEKKSQLNNGKAQRQLKKLGIGFKRTETPLPTVTRKVKRIAAPSAIEDPTSNDLMTSSSKLAIAGTSEQKAESLKLQQQPGLPRTKMLSRNDWEEQAYQIIRQQKLRDASLREGNIAAQAQNALKLSSGDFGSSKVERPRPDFLPSLDGVSLVGMEDKLFGRLSHELVLEQKCRPLIEYLHLLGVGEEDFRRIADRHKACLQVNVIMVKERVDYLVGLGVEREHLSKLIVRHPQILEYTVERALKPRIQYLKSLGISESKLGRVITVAPSLLECSLERSLKPRVSYLKQVVGIKDADIGLIVTRSPQILTQSIEDSLEPRVEFFMIEMGVTKEKLAKMVTRHPQLLHYSVEDGICSRVEYLKSIGLSREDILKVFTRLTQVLSLSIENCLKPKYEYLVKELNGGPHTVTSFPAYFSLSLEQRIKPRHRYLISLQRLPVGPFPMKSLAVTDSCFCKQWAKTTVEEYQAFRNALLLSNFAKKFEWKNKVLI